MGIKQIINLKKPLLIAEIGINHNGNFSLAKKLIDQAKECKFDIVKFQKRDPDICVPEKEKFVDRDTPWGKMSYLEYKKKIEFNKKEYDQINKYCNKIKIKWFASAWDKNSFYFLNKYKCKFNKISSAMITNLNFLDLVAKARKKTFISTGMCNLSDISNAVKIFKKNKCPFVLLHCVSSYPASEKSLNLNTIITLSNKFNCEVGYSGHESSVSPSWMAYLLGATVIERHITIDRAMWGTDQSASLGKSGMINLQELINKSPSILGNGKKIKSSSDKKLEKKFRYWI